MSAISAAASKFVAVYCYCVLIWMEMNKKLNNEIDPIWKDIEKYGYKLIQKIGEGSFGTVY